MTRDEAREFLQSLESFANDQIVESDIQSDMDLVIALAVKTESAESERCARIAESAFEHNSPLGIYECYMADGKRVMRLNPEASASAIAREIRKDRGSDPPQAETK